MHILWMIKVVFTACFSMCLFATSYAKDDIAQSEIINIVQSVLAQPIMGPAEYESNFTTDQKIIHGLLQDDLAYVLKLTETEQKKLSYEHLFEAFLTLERQKPDRLQDHTSFQLLQTASQSDAWEEQNISNLLIANIYLKRGNEFEGLKYAHDGLAVIPNNASKAVRNARYNSYYMLHIAYTLDQSPKAVLNAVQKLVEINGTQPVPFTQFSVIYNLGASYHQASDYVTALDISKLLLEDSKTLSPRDRFIANLSYGRNLIYLKRFDEAQPYIVESIDLAPNDTYEVYARVLLVETLSELGKYDQARKQISVIEATDVYYSGDSIGEQQKILKSKALIAAGDQKFKKAYGYNKTYSDKKIKDLSQALSNDRRDLHQRVLLSQELSEKELEKAGLQLALDHAKLERQRMINNVYLLLMGLGLIAMIGALLFVRKLGLLNRKLFLANEQVKEKAKIKSELLAMFSHEMLTPLNGIIPLADVLRQSEGDSHKQHLLKTIEANGAELTRKIREIIMVANPDEQVNSPTDVNVKSFLQNSRQEHETDIPAGVAFNVKIAPDMPQTLRLDPERLELIVEALLSNSKKYTKGGEIRMSFYLDVEKRPTLEITDTGHGMPNHHVEEMIKPFGQASLSIDRTNQGLGLGLTIVRLHCAIMNAQFNMQSEEGVGTVTHIIFPRESAVPQTISSKRAA